jgi:PAS domain S-box-containing protein
MKHSGRPAERDGSHRHPGPRASVSGAAASRVSDRRDRAIDVRERLIASEECLRLLFEDHPQPMAIYETESLRLLDVNDAAVALYGYSTEELLGMTVRDLSLWPDASERSEDVIPVDAETAAAPVIRKHARKDRTPIDVEISSRELPLSGLPVRVRFAIRRIGCVSRPSGRFSKRSSATRRSSSPWGASPAASRTTSTTC